MGPEEWEGIARDALEGTCTVAPVDTCALAVALGVRVLEYPGHEGFADVLRRCVYIPARPMRNERREGNVAHELAHVLLRDHGLDIHNEEAARYIAGALRVPREELDRALRRTWSIRAMRARFGASHEMLVRRITQVRPAIATVIDGGRVTVRVASPWLAGRAIATTPRVWELGLVTRALEDGEAEGDGPSVATHAGGDRVVMVTRRWWASDRCEGAAAVRA